MDKENIGEEVVSSYILGGEIREGSMVWWENLAFYCEGCAAKVKKLKEYMIRHGSGPFVIVKIVEYPVKETTIVFKDIHGDEAEISEEFFCADINFSFTEGERFNISVSSSFTRI